MWGCLGCGNTKSMGADMVELLDRRMAEVVISASDADLVALVDLRTRPNQAPPVWRNYWDPTSEYLHDFTQDTGLSERFRRIIAGGTGITEIKDEMIRELCTGGWMTLDYWGCMAEVFRGLDPPGSLAWEDFIGSIHGGATERGSSGRYILTTGNVAQMMRSLRENQKDLQRMNDESLARLDGWHSLCKRCSDFSVVYQIDF